MAGPWEKYSGQAAQPQPQQDPVIARDPYKVEDQQIQRDAAARAARDQELQERRFQITQEREAARDERAAEKDRQGSVEQTKAKGFLTRGLQAEKDYSGLGDVGSRGYLGQKIANIDPEAANYFSDSNRQMADQAQRAFIAAILRYDSGAAIPDSEFITSARIYFPQPGEGPEVIAQKARARMVALQGLRDAAGPSAADVQIEPPEGATDGQTPEDAKKASIALWGGEYYDDQGNPLGPDGGPAYDKDGQPVGLMARVSDEAPPSGPNGGPPETRDPSGLSGLGALARQGVTIGLSDEAAGIGGYLSGFLTGEDPSKAYVRERDTERQFIDKARNEWGAMGIGAEILGGGGAARIADAPVALGSIMRQGSALGAVGGFGYGEGNASVPNALLGAGVGGAAGGALYGAGKGLNALYQARRGGPMDIGVVQAGERQGVPIRQADARPALRGQYAAAESTENGGAMIRAARSADTDRLEQRVAEIGGQGTASDPYALGTQVQQAGQRYIARTKQQANRLYERARQTSQGQAVEAKDALAAVEANLAELRAAGENSNRGQIAYLEGLRDDLSKPLTIEAVQNLRTNMRGQLSERNLTGTDAERRVKQVIDAANSDLVRDLPQEASTALRAADDFYRQRQEFINTTLSQFVKRDNSLPAETAAKRLVSMAQGKGNFERFSAMWKELETAERADAAATIASSLGRGQNGNFSPAILLKSLDPKNGINPRTARLVFGDDGAKALEDLRVIARAKVDAMDRMSPSGKAIASQAGGLKTLLAAALGFGAGGPNVAIAGGVAQRFFQKWGEERAARMLLNPEFTRWLKSAPESAKPQVIDRYFSRLAGIGSIAANDNQAFTNALMAALRKSPGAAAAGESGDSRREPPSR